MAWMSQRLGAQRHLASRLLPLVTELWLPPPCLRADSELDKQRRAEWRPGCYVRVHGHISNFGGLLLPLRWLSNQGGKLSSPGLGTAEPTCAQQAAAKPWPTPSFSGTARSPACRQEPGGDCIQHSPGHRPQRGAAALCSGGKHAAPACLHVTVLVCPCAQPV